ILWPHGQDRHLAAVLLLHAQRLLDGHFVVATYGLLGRRTVEASVGQQRLLGGRQRGLLDANDDVQRHISSQLTRAPVPLRYTTRLQHAGIAALASALLHERRNRAGGMRYSRGRR